MKTCLCAGDIRGSVPGGGGGAGPLLLTHGEEAEDGCLGRDAPGHRDQGSPGVREGAPGALAALCDASLYCCRGEHACLAPVLAAVMFSYYSSKHSLPYSELLLTKYIQQPTLTFYTVIMDQIKTASTKD